MKQEMKDVIYEKGKAGYAGLYLVSSEDMLMQMQIREAAKELKRDLYVWTFGKGLVADAGKTPKPIEATQNPAQVLEHAKTLDPKSIIILRLFHHYLDDHSIQAKLIDLLPMFKLSMKMLIVLTPVQNIPPELEKDFTLIESSLPSKSMLEKVLKGINVTDEKKPSPALQRELVDAACGLTTTEAENVFALSLVRPAYLKTPNIIWDPKVVLEEKCAALKKTGLLEYIPTEGVNMSSVGGMKELKKWVARRKRAFTDEARAFGLPPPKGILMVGPPGSGKSLGAKAVTAELGLPLIRCDFGKLFGSLVGQSEGNMRKAIEGAEAMAPCVFWIDEIEKALAGSSGGSSDSGVGARLLGYLLTWMQEKVTSVFVYATANDVTSLPPELLRKGRFDEMWSVLLPNQEERKEILEIHLRKRKREASIGKSGVLIDLDKFAKLTAGFSGAEIEAAIIEAMYQSFDENHVLNRLDLEAACKSLLPLSKTMAERLLALERWCLSRTRPANGDDSTSVEETMKEAGGRTVEA